MSYKNTIIWKAQGVPQENNVAHPEHPEEDETSPNRLHINKQQIIQITTLNTYFKNI